MISVNGIVVDKKKVEAIPAWLVPSSVKVLIGFLGITGYYRKFVKGYSSIAANLINLLKKGAFVWD